MIKSEDFFNVFSILIPVRYLHLFDPWSFPLCTCPKKYSVDPYTGCAHRCVYCYITSYIPQPYNVRPKKDFLRMFERDIKKAKEKLPVSMSNSSDPYPPIETELMLTRGALRILRTHDFPVLMLTKSDMVARDKDILSQMRAYVSITVTSLELDYLLEPGAPSAEKRLSAMEKLVEKGISVGARIDPLIPTVNDSERSLKKLVMELASIGVSQITASTYKSRPDNFCRVIAAFPGSAEKLKEIYLKQGEIVRGTRYAPSSMRWKMLIKVRKLADRYEIPFAVCREGLDLNTALTCDGSHLVTSHKRYSER